MINEEGLRDWFGKSKSKDGKPGWVQSDGSPCANEPGEKGTPKCYSSSKKSSMSKKELRSADTRKSRQDPGQQSKSGAAKPTYVSTDKPKKKMKEETFNEAEDKKTKGSGTKDACYSKVKSRYSVWPSAYASGALVKCRKVGDSNWGNKSESVEYSDWRDDFRATEYEFIDIIKPEPLVSESPSFEIKKNDEVQGPEVPKEKQWNAGPASRRAKEGIDRLKKKLKKEEVETVDELKCWKGFKRKKGSVPGAKGSCVKAHAELEGEQIEEEKEESKIDGSNLKKLAAKAVRRVDADVDGDVDTDDMKSSETGEFVPSPDGKKLKPKVRFEGASDWRSELGEGAAWTKKSGKNKKGGLNEKGRKSYEAENPGSDLKAPSKKKGNKRRASFCARMKGMKAKLTSAKTARDPDSRINKSLRAWNCR